MRFNRFYKVSFERQTGIVVNKIFSPRSWLERHESRRVSAAIGQRLSLEKASDMGDVVPCHEQHQGKNEAQSEAETKFLRPFAQGTAAQSLDRVEHQVPAIEHRDGQKIIRPIETDRIAARLIRASNPPFDATRPET